MLKKIKDYRRSAIKNKAILSFKYEHLICRINFIQVSVIIISTIIVFLETIKMQLKLEDIIYEIIPIVLSTYITLVMAILRFFKWEERKENISKLRENYSFLINKFEKVKFLIKNFEYNDNKKNEWGLVISKYDADVDDYITIKESFDNTISYKEAIYYKKKFRKLYLELEFINRDVDCINNFKDDSKKSHNEYMKKSCCLRICCCSNKKIIDYELFFKELSELTEKKTKKKLDDIMKDEEEEDTQHNL